MKSDEGTIRLSHGNGGSLMHELIEKVFLSRFGNRYLLQRSDSAILPPHNEEIAFTTDSFVVDPIFFPGGDIGKLAVCGTVNDLAVSGATPRYLSLAMVIEEGLQVFRSRTHLRINCIRGKKSRGHHCDRRYKGRSGRER